MSAADSWAQLMHAARMAGVRLTPRPAPTAPTRLTPTATLALADEAQLALHIDPPRALACLTLTQPRRTLWFDARQRNPRRLPMSKSRKPAPEPPPPVDPPNAPAPPPVKSEAAQADPSADLAPMSEGEKLIRIEDILLLGNHRIDTPDERSRLEELVASLQTNGQLQPIGVFRREASTPGEPFALIWGERRLLAARELAKRDARWESIGAEVYPPLTERQVEVLRAVENLHRDELNPVEEALAATKVLRLLGGDVAATALKLGRSEKWVRDRGYLSRLAAPVQQLVAQGYLPIHHAREIAKVTDHAEQVALAAHAAGAWSWQAGGEDRIDAKMLASPARQVASIEETTAAVQAKLRSLDRVPWNLALPLAGLPACVGCKDNTRADPVLFEDVAAADQDARGRCTNAACFGKKSKACEKHIRDLAAAAKAPAAMETDAIKERIAVKTLPLNPTIVALAVRDNLRQAGRLAGSANRTGEPRQKVDPRQTAWRKFTDLWRGWCNECAAVVSAKLLKTHGLAPFVGAYVLQHKTDVFRSAVVSLAWDVPAAGKPAAAWDLPKPPLATAIDALLKLPNDPAWDAVARLMKNSQIEELNDLFNDSAVFAYLARRLDVSLPDEPQWESMDPAAPKTAPPKAAQTPESRFAQSDTTALSQSPSPISVTVVREAVHAALMAKKGAAKRWKALGQELSDHELAAALKREWGTPGQLELRPKLRVAYAVHAGVPTIAIEIDGDGGKRQTHFVSGGLLMHEVRVALNTAAPEKGKPKSPNSSR